LPKPCDTLPVVGLLKKLVTCCMFSSISSSLSSFVTLATNAPVGISTPGFGGALPPEI